MRLKDQIPTRIAFLNTHQVALSEINFIIITIGSDNEN